MKMNLLDKSLHGKPYINPTQILLELFGGQSLPPVSNQIHRGKKTACKGEIVPKEWHTHQSQLSLLKATWSYLLVGLLYIIIMCTKPGIYQQRTACFEIHHAKSFCTVGNILESPERINLITAIKWNISEDSFSLSLPLQNEREQIMTTNVWLNQVTKSTKARSCKPQTALLSLHHSDCFVCAGLDTPIANV